LTPLGEAGGALVEVGGALVEPGGVAGGVGGGGGGPPANDFSTTNNPNNATNTNTELAPITFFILSNALSSFHAIQKGRGGGPPIASLKYFTYSSLRKYAATSLVVAATKKM
jgi:hypothetical protein